jgi:hypothetical protein
MKPTEPNQDVKLILKDGTRKDLKDATLEDLLGRPYSQLTPVEKETLTRCSSVLIRCMLKAEAEQKANLKQE